MMNYIWAGIIIFSVISSIIFNTTSELSSGIITSGNSAVELCLTLLGTFCLWNGLMSVAEKSELTKYVSKIMSPIICKLFKNIKKDDKVLEPICLNITSNLLGISNAATPIGIEAMKRLAEKNKEKKSPNNDMVLFVVINSAALRLIPTTIIALIEKNGSTNSLGIVLPSIITSTIALIVGITMTKIMERLFKHD